VNLSTTIFGLTPESTHAVARQADAGGFEIVWLADHALTPLAFQAVYPYDDTGRPGYPAETPLIDVWVMIGHLSATLTNIRFGTGVYILPLRDPLVIAQAMRTAFELSKGRLIAGFGTGWMREEFDAMRQPFEDRGHRSDEMLDILELAWSGRPFEYHGRFYDIEPVQQGGQALGHVPRVFGGTSPRALGRCARRGDGWFGPPGCPLSQLVEYRRALEELRDRHGRTQEPFRYFVRSPGGADDASFTPFLEAGFEDLVVSLPRRSDGTVDMAEVTDFVAAASRTAHGLSR
jgi:probable F420-dependent oxidoreductase